MNEIELGFEVYKCLKCKKLFSAGLDRRYFSNLQAKNPLITLHEAFEIYSKYLASLKSSPMHLQKKPKNCPFCQSKKFNGLNYLHRCGLE